MGDVATMSFTPTAGQANALTAFSMFMDHDVSEWQVFVLCGYAGTGKSTLVNHLVRDLITRHGSQVVRVVAPTGKAASVLIKKGMHATTIHRLLYTPVTVKDEETGRVTLEWALRDLRFELEGVKLLVVDEASMVDADLTRDLLATGIKILAIGDPFQLPPVRATRDDEHVLLDHRTEPSAMLTEVTRQALDSPVLWLATQVRERQVLPTGRHGDSIVIPSRDADRLTFTGEAPFIVGRNKTRHAQNFAVRQILGRRGWEPECGDRLLCRRNDGRTGLVNGELVIVTDVFPNAWKGERISLVIKAEDDPSLEDINLVSTTERTVSAWTHLFRGEDGEAELKRKPAGARRLAQELTYGYAITAHASQGSEWPTVVVIDESGVFRDDRWRWLYTAVTRASERVAVIT